jgi:predicted dehydrogenase
MAKIRTGVIGMGWGQLQLESFKRAKDFQVVALCDADTARLKETASKYKIDQTFADYREMIARADIDFISVASPPDCHSAMAQAAIDAGKHVLIEKPLALNVNDARALLKSAEAKGIVHAVDFEMRYLPALAYAKELIDEKYLGQLLLVDVTMGMLRPWGEHGNWAAEDARGGGILMELGSHFIDALLWWFGDVRAVFAGRRTHFSTVKIPTFEPKLRETILVKKPVTGDDSFWCVFQFASGGEALLNFVTGARHDPGWTISAYGSAGTLIVNSGQLLGMRDVDREMAILPIPKRLELGDNPKDPLMWSMAKLAERMGEKINRARDAQPFPDFGDGVAVAQIIDAIRSASDKREWVELKTGDK